MQTQPQNQQIAPPKADDSVLSVTQIREIRRPLISRMIESVANVGNWRISDADFAAAVEDWDEVLSCVPFEDLNRLRQVGLAEGKTKAPEFLEMWQASRGAYARLIAESQKDAKRERDYAEQPEPMGPGRRAMLEYLAERGYDEERLAKMAGQP